MANGVRYISLSHSLTDNMAVYPGSDKPVIEKRASVATDGYELSVITSDFHVGTHIDAPLHMVEGGLCIDQLPIEQFFGLAQVLDIAGKSVVEVADLAPLNFVQCDILLFHTGMDKYFGEPCYFDQHPVLSEQAAQFLAHSPVKIVGFDCPSPDRKPFNVHRILLGAKVLIIENLTGLSQLIGHVPFEFIALPPKVHTEAAFIHAVAKLPANT